MSNSLLSGLSGYLSASGAIFSEGTASSNGRNTPVSVLSRAESSLDSAQRLGGMPYMSTSAALADKNFLSTMTAVKTTLETAHRLGGISFENTSILPDKNSSDLGTAGGGLGASGGPTPHSCRYCNKAFYGNVDLARHERTHTGEKPFACTFCSYRSAQLGNLQRHVKSVHREDAPHCSNSQV